MRLLLGFVCCAAAFGASDTAPGFRLPADAQPTRYDLTLTIVPSEANFSGTQHIAVKLRQRTKSLWLNAKGLTVDRASIRVNGAERPATAKLAGDEFLQLSFEEAAGPGAAEVEIAFRGKLSDKANNGLYRKSDGVNWYAYTTFTPIEARRAFPCFDEPGYKTPWRIVLHVPQSDIASSNAPMMKETPEAGGMKRVVFRETQPLASEVVAVAVGPFDVVNAGVAGKNRVPVRVLAPRGRARDADAAKRATAEILPRLEQYTGIAYPWEKLDWAAVLDMPYGAVENPGLITYRDRGLLAKPELDTPERQRSMRGTMAHELAHQWFGNLVTQAWWDDAWLSEGFATWLGGKVSDLELPAFERSIASTANRLQIMRADAAASTRPVRLAMNSREDMDRVYSGIVYQKGAAVLNMVEQWLGPEAFQRGLRTYLKEHAHGNATTSDLADALRREASTDVSQVLHSFLDQTGYPMMRAAGECSFQAGDAGRWIVPVCAHRGDGASQCAVMSAGQPELPSVGVCPAWTWPNRGASGYFRVELTGPMVEAIVKNGWDQMTVPEKMAMLDDAAFLAAARRLNADVLLKALPTFAKDLQPAVVSGAYRLLLTLSVVSTSSEERSRYEETVKQVLGAGRGRR